MVEICRYLESRFGKGSTVSSQLTGFGVKSLSGKSYTACSLWADTQTLASMRKARRCLAFWQRELFKVFAKFVPSSDIDASGSNLDQNLDRAIVRQSPGHGGIWRISRRVAQNGVLNPGTCEVAEKVAETSGQVAGKVAEKQGEYTENPSEYTEKYPEKGAEYTETSTESAETTAESNESRRKCKESVAESNETGTARTGTTSARTGTGRGLSGTGWTVIGTTAQGVMMTPPAVTTTPPAITTTPNSRSQGLTSQPQGPTSQPQGLTSQVSDVTTTPTTVTTTPQGENAPAQGENAPAQGENAPAQLTGMLIPLALEEKIGGLGRHVKAEILRDIIIELCKVRPMSKDDLMQILGRKERTIKKLVTPLLGKELDYLYPMMVHHPRQAYVASGKRKGNPR